MWTKLLFALSLLVLVSVVQAQDVHTVKITVPRQENEDACKALYNEIEDDFTKANYCKIDSDCKTVDLGGWYVEFGCYKFVNKTTNEKEIFAKIEKYKREMKCSLMIDRCATSPIAVCLNDKCVVKSHIATEEAVSKEL